MVDALKRVKAVETEWDARLAEARETSRRELARKREEADAAVKAVLQEAEAERLRALERARIVSEAEARGIVSEGEAAARKVRDEREKRGGGRNGEILAAVLGSFASD